ncbi:MAG: carbonic anhydrase [Enhygromyxa sp.]
MTDQNNVSAAEALERLRAGNARFAGGVRSVATLSSQLDREQHAAGQRPFAVILTCSDSRVPAELVFDQGIGDLFVIRVAGNVIAPSLVGSVEFAAAKFGTQLVVVLGHSSCGAVTATLDVIRGRAEVATSNLGDIVDRIRPAVATLVEVGAGEDEAGLLEAAVRANVRSSVAHLRHASRLLEDMVQKGTVVVVGAEYDLVSGRVDFFDAPADLAAAE